MVMNFNKGDKVKFLDEAGEGIIISVVGEKAQVMTSDGFEISYPISKLVHAEIVSEIKKEKTKEETISDKLKLFLKKKKEKGPKFSKSNTDGKKSFEREVDLHLEEILDSEKGMNNSQKLEYQLNYFRKEMESAFTSGIRKIIFIHGVGNGRLKAEIRKELDAYENISYSDASHARYGVGATEVIIR